MFECKDVIIYDELWDIIPVALVVKKQAAVIQDVFGFYHFASIAIGDEVTFIYRCRQVLADKEIGSGEAILAGDKLYYYPSTDKVRPVAIGVFGVDYYFCGWAKRNAGANEATVLMNFDGTRWNENL
jgi:hypothetical protein